MIDETTFDPILEIIMPLYTQVHPPVRGRLCDLYPGTFDCIGPTPAHILGEFFSVILSSSYNHS